MNGPPPIPPMAALPINQRNVDEDHLNLLAIFHFVVAAMTLMGILFLFAHYMMMHFIFTNPDIGRIKRAGPRRRQFLAYLSFFTSLRAQFWW